MNNHRDVLVELVRKNGWTRGAELGLASGQTLEALLASKPDLHMIGVDRAINPPRWIKVVAVAHRYAGRCTLHPMHTDMAAQYVDDASLDFVFIDADHRYPAVADDIKRWRTKLKPGGTLLGHDYCEPWPGVVQAVDEAFKGAHILHPHSVWEVRL